MPRIFDSFDQKLLPGLRKTLERNDHVDFSGETLDIRADKKLSKKLLKRRKDAFDEKEKGELIEAKDLFPGLSSISKYDVERSGV